MKEIQKVHRKWTKGEKLNRYILIFQQKPHQGQDKGVIPASSSIAKEPRALNGKAGQRSLFFKSNWVKMDISERFLLFFFFKMSKQKETRSPIRTMRWIPTNFPSQLVKYSLFMRERHRGPAFPGVHSFQLWVTCVRCSPGKHRLLFFDIQGRHFDQPYFFNPYFFKLS